MSHFTEKEIQNYCIQTARKLVTIPKSSKFTDIKRPTKIVFPEYKHSNEQKDRISEQELRLCFCMTLQRISKPLYFALETPTKEKYKLSVKTKRATKTVGRSGNMDLSIYSIEKNKVKKDINVEFKHGNPPLENVLIDLLKLSNEHHSALYYIHLEHLNNATLSSKSKSGLINKIICALTNKKIATTKKGEHLINQFIVLAIALPSHGHLLLKTIPMIDLRTNKTDELREKLTSMLFLEYKVSNDKLKIINKNKWRVVKL